MSAANDLDPLLVCAFCPSACRRAAPAEAGSQVESRLPSALALLSVNIRQGALAYDASMRGALQDLEVARQCSAICSYGYDIPARLADFTTEMDALHGKP